MAGLLVSVRSAVEALAACAGGAAVIDVKEPAWAPLGQADPAVWQAVRAVVPRAITMSVALGELVEWRGRDPIDPARFDGISYRKLGLAGADRGWADEWASLRAAWGDGPGWIAVAYADWEAARAPHPDDVLEVALASGCAGVLVDTWAKGRPSPVDRSWLGWAEAARARGLLVALAGGLDEAAIVRLGCLDPDLFAVRGAACAGGNRLAPVEAGRVALLAAIAAAATPPLRDTAAPTNCRSCSDRR